jgi:hypothetical protein
LVPTPSSSRTILVGAGNPDTTGTLLDLAACLVEGDLRYGALVAAKLSVKGREIDEKELEEFHLDIEALETRGLRTETRGHIGTCESITDGLIELGQKLHAHTAIIGWHRSVEGLNVFGGVVGELLARAPFDVTVLIDPLTSFGLRFGSTILVPFGGGHHEVAALEHGAALARSSESRLHLVTVSTERYDPDVAGALDVWANRLRADGTLVDATTVVGDPAQTIADVAKQAQVCVLGAGEDWATNPSGIGSLRLPLAAMVENPVVVVRRASLPPSDRPWRDWLNEGVRPDALEEREPSD